MKRLLCSVLLVLAVAASSALGVTLYVNAGAGAESDGTSWAQAFKTLTNALVNTAAGAGHHLWVAEGTYSPGSVEADAFDLKNDIHLYGGFVSNGTWATRNWDTQITALDGGGVSYHVVAISGAATWTVDGFLVTNGVADGAGNDEQGAGIFGGGAGVNVIRNCRVQGNVAHRRGAGIYLYNVATIDNCTIIGNEEHVDDSAGGGGGIYINGDFAVTITNCTIAENISESSGAGLRIEHGQVTLLNCTFRANENDLGDTGAAIYSGSSSSADLTAQGCVFIDHTTAHNSGTVHIDQSRATIENCTFVGGGAFDSGVLKFNKSPLGIVRDCRFVGNHSRNQCASIDLNDGLDWGLAYTGIVENCVFAGNVASYGIMVIGSSNSMYATVRNCLLVGNYGRVRAALTSTDAPGGQLLIDNCLFADNYGASGGGAAILNGPYAPKGNTNLVIKNCIFWGNEGDSYEIRNRVEGPTVSYNDTDGGFGAIGPTNVIDGGGNTKLNPLFAGVVAIGDWSAQGSYDPLTGQTKLTDAGAGWTDNEFYDLFVLPDTASTVTSNKYLQFLVASNDSDEIWIWSNSGRLGVLPTNAAPYTINDYHLKSIGERYTPLAWVTDTVNSPCIDAGDPTSSYDGEPQPHGWRVNMGGYGNTAQASKVPPSGTLFLIM